MLYFTHLQGSAVSFWNVIKKGWSDSTVHWCLQEFSQEPYFHTFFTFCYAENKQLYQPVLYYLTVTILYWIEVKYMISYLSISFCSISGLDEQTLLLYTITITLSNWKIKNNDALQWRLRTNAKRWHLDILKKVYFITLFPHQCWRKCVDKSEVLPWNIYIKRIKLWNL